VVNRALGGPRDRRLESLASDAAAGLGTTALMLAILALGSNLGWARWILPTGALVTIVAALWTVSVPRSSFRVPRSVLVQRGTGSGLTYLLIAMVALGAIGAFAPVTEFDSLSYPIPIARHLAETGLWQFWPDQARSVFPLSQELLVVPLIHAGSNTLGLVSAAEFVLAACLIVALARRVSRDPSVPACAAIITLGCPAVAFLAASAKADLLLLVMTTAAAVSLVSPPSRGAVLRVGLFAGFAAGTKLTGVPIAIATLCCVPWACGRLSPMRDLTRAALLALLAGGLWYGVTFARFGNPLPLMSLGPWFSAPLMSPAVLADWANGFGNGRSFIDALVAPFYLSVGSEIFGGRGNWINALAFLGIGAAVVRGLRRETWILTIIAVAAYVAWFRQIQVGRLLLPALALLSIPAAELLMRAWQRWRLARTAILVVLLASAGVVAAAGVLRVERYVRDPSTFLARETPHYDAIAWMNTHLDLTRDRVASSFESSAYLRVPWVALNGTYQTVIGADEIDDRTRLLAALSREHFTHVFGPPDAFQEIADALEVVYENPASRVGGSSFFRTPRTEAVSVYRIR
jgi:hypothetical protein